MTIKEIAEKYKGRIDYFDLELLIANSLGKTREFVLTHPEYEIPSFKIGKLKLKISRRMSGEPIAYITGHKEFNGLDFAVNEHTLIPRPETEQLVDLAIKDIHATCYMIHDTCIVDVGTGSGNIIISIAHTIEHGSWSMDQKEGVQYFAIDISNNALKIARKNARVHSVDKRIKFLQGNLLSPIIENCKFNPPAGGENSTIIIVANLPYLSKEIYESAPVDVKSYEPKTALYSPEKGLQHYRKLLEQIRLVTSYELQVTVFLEISPEQKKLLPVLIKSIFPKAKISFQKDLADKWRICKISL